MTFCHVYESNEDILTFKNILRSYKNMKILDITTGLNVSSVIAEMRSIKVLKLCDRYTKSLEDLIEICEGRELGFTIFPRKIT